MIPQRHIVALGGGSFRTHPGNALETFLLELTGKERPRVLFLPTAGGDQEATIELFRERFLAGRCEPSVLRLFGREHEDLAPILLEQDLVFVGGGNTANQRAIWRIHGVDRLLATAWARGIVLAGVSAGALCWFHEGVTDSFHPTKLQPIHGLLGFLPGSFCPHYDSEANRRPLYQEFVGTGKLAAGFAADDGVGLVFRDTVFLEAVSFLPGKSAWRVEPCDNSRPGAANETRIPARLL